MDTKTAKQIGQRLGLRSAVIGIVTAYLVYAGVLFQLGGNPAHAFLWLLYVDYAVNTVVGAIGLLLMGWLFGQLAGLQIIFKKRNELLIGVLTGLLTLLTGTLIGSTLGYLEEGFDNSDVLEALFDYYYKPLFWVTTFGTIPAIVVGIWFGRQIKKQGLKISVDQDASRQQ